MLIFLCALLFIPPPFFRYTIQTGTDDEFTHFAIQIRRRRPSFYAFLLIRYSPFFFWCASYLGDGSRCSCSLRLAEESEELGKKNWGRQGEPLVDGPSERTRAQGGRRERHADGEPDFLAAAKVASGIGNDDDDVGRHLVDEVTRSFTGIWGIRFQ